MPSMQTTDVITYYGSPAEVARILGISRAAVSKWAKEGIVPEGSAYKIESLTRGKLKVNPSDYQPRASETCT